MRCPGCSRGGVKRTLVSETRWIEEDYSFMQKNGIRAEWEKFKTAKRNTYGGEYRSLLTLVDAKGFQKNIDFAEFSKIVSNPCRFCGETTPGYECNSINPGKDGVYDDTAYAICWPCKNLLGFKPKLRVHQAIKVALYMSRLEPAVQEEDLLEEQWPEEPTKLRPTHGLIYKLMIGGRPYVGKTTGSLEQRVLGHIRSTYKPARVGGIDKVHEALKLTRNITWDVLEDNIPIAQLDARERYYIDKYDSVLGGLNFALPIVD